ncbi:SDR family oxidoreductase, partial [Actinobacillus porcinus]
TNPQGVYGRTKLEGEIAVQQANPRSIILRTAWVFGEHGHNFVKTMLRLAKDRDSLGIVGDQFGGPTYAGDIAKALIEIANQILAGKENAFGVYHFTGKPYVSWYEFANAIFVEAESQKLLEKQPHLKAITTAEYPTPAKRPANSRLDLTKIKQTFNIEPSDWQKALKNIKAYAS